MPKMPFLWHSSCQKHICSCHISEGHYKREHFWGHMILEVAGFAQIRTIDLQISQKSNKIINLNIY